MLENKLKNIVAAVVAGVLISSNVLASMPNPDEGKPLTKPAEASQPLFDDYYDPDPGSSMFVQAAVDSGRATESWLSTVGNGLLVFGGLLAFAALKRSVDSPAAPASALAPALQISDELRNIYETPPAPAEYYGPAKSDQAEK